MHRLTLLLVLALVCELATGISARFVGSTPEQIRLVRFAAASSSQALAVLAVCRAHVDRVQSELDHEFVALVRGSRRRVTESARFRVHRR